MEERSCFNCKFGSFQKCLKGEGGEILDSRDVNQNTDDEYDCCLDWEERHSKPCGENHSYTEWSCEKCGQSMCWECGVRCTDDGTGEGPITCPHCGADGGYYE